MFVDRFLLAVRALWMPFFQGMPGGRTVLLLGCAATSLASSCSAIGGHPSIERESVERAGLRASRPGAPSPSGEQEAGAGGTADDLSKQATDPTASLMSLGLIGTYTGAYHGNATGLDDHTSALKLQPVIPFKAWGASNILRISLPYTFDGRGQEGLGDVTVFDLVTLNASWGRWGVGPVLTLAGDSAAPDPIVIGPALGCVYQASKTLNLGLFNQNVFGGDTSISQLQPIVAYQLGDGWALSAGDLQLVYDWRDGRWLSLPIGFQLGKVKSLWKQPFRFAVNPQYNFADDDGLSEWQIAISATLLAPSR